MAHDMLVARGIYPTAQRVQALIPYTDQPGYVGLVETQIRENAYAAGNDVGVVPVNAEVPVFPATVKPETFLTREISYPKKPMTGIPLLIGAAAAAYFYFK